MCFSKYSISKGMKQFFHNVKIIVKIFSKKIRESVYRYFSPSYDNLSSFRLSGSSRLRFPPLFLVTNVFVKKATGMEAQGKVWLHRLNTHRIDHYLLRKDSKTPCSNSKFQKPFKPILTYLAAHHVVNICFTVARNNFLTLINYGGESWYDLRHHV